MFAFLTFFTTFVIFFIQGSIFGIFASLLARRKGYSAAGWFFIGLFFSFIGLLVAIGLPDKSNKEADLRTKQDIYEEMPMVENQMTNEINDSSNLVLIKKCPDCREVIKIDARVCRYCGHKFSNEEIISELKQGLERVEKDGIVYWRIVAALAQIGDEWSITMIEKHNPLIDLALEKLRRIAGKNIVGFAENLENEWICICGTQNDKNAKHCWNCGIPRDYALKRFTKKAMMKMIEE